MSKENNREHEARVLSLVISLHSATWASLGKVAHPMTGKVERNLDAARSNIDLIESLMVMTHNAVSDQGRKIMEDCISALRLNYVEEVSKKEEATGPGEAEHKEEDGGMVEEKSEGGEENGAEAADERGDGKE